MTERRRPRQVLIYERKGDYVNDTLIRTLSFLTIAVVLVLALLFGFDITN